MANIARVPITNVYAGGDYTGLIQVGAKAQPMNVLLDTGSSALARSTNRMLAAAIRPRSSPRPILTATEAHGPGP